MAATCRSGDSREDVVRYCTARLLGRQESHSSRPGSTCRFQALKDQVSADQLAAIARAMEDPGQWVNVPTEIDVLDRQVLRVCSGIGDAFGPSEMGLLLGARRKDMPAHIRRRATRQRANFAGSLRDGAYVRQSRVAKALWCTGTTAASAPNPGGRTPRQMRH